MTYCPIALMEEIRGSSSSISSNSSSRNGRGSSSSSTGSVGGSHHGMIQVQFPPLPANPPTDCSDATTTTSSMSSTPTTKDGLRATSSSPDDHDLARQRQQQRRISGGSDDCDGGAADGLGEELDGARKPPPEGQAPPPPPPRQRRAADSASSDDEMMEIEDIDFDDADHEGGAPLDPAVRIKAALDKVVVFVRRRKKGMEERRKAQQQLQRRRQQQQHDTSARSSSDGGGGAPASPVRDASDAGKCPPSAMAGVNPAREGPATPSPKELPVQVIMTWMDTFQDHEKIQLICLQSLPAILEDPPNRLAAQADGLASIVLYDLAAFPSNSLLQLTAFHTLVVLLRPLGANEGMVHSAAYAHSGNATSKSSRGIRSIDHKKHRQGGVTTTTTRKVGINDIGRHGTPSSGGGGRTMSPIIDPRGMTGATALLDASYEPHWEENGVRVMLDSLRRFSSDRYLQAMGCWAMVNAALYPSLKASLVRLGGVYAVTNAMMLHPNVEAVQFRGLFALINLVIPSDKTQKNRDGSFIHSHIYQIARLTIVAMKNFHANKSILNRGCLVLRNLSLTPAFVKILARTPGCVDMLLHCRQMCPRDVLVQRSARTIMILVQRATEKDGGGLYGDKDGLGLARPRPLPGSMHTSTSEPQSLAASSSTGGGGTPPDEGPKS